MAESIYSLRRLIGGMIHIPFPLSGVERRQNLCFASLWRLTGNDFRYPQIDIAILRSAADIADRRQILRASTSSVGRPMASRQAEVKPNPLLDGLAFKCDSTRKWNQIDNCCQLISYIKYLIFYGHKVQ